MISSLFFYLAVGHDDFFPSVGFYDVLPNGIRVFRCSGNPIIYFAIFSY